MTKSISRMTAIIGFGAALKVTCLSGKRVSMCARVWFIIYRTAY